jgi:type I restriction-modification system DNA methylase subunit
MLHGMDYDEAAAWSGKTNVDLHGFGGSYLQQADALDLASGSSAESFDVVAGNPPFGDKITDPSILEQFELGHDPKERPLAQQTSEVLFLEAFLRLAKPCARVAILLPDGILANVGEQRVRDYLLRTAFVEAVVALPRRVFRNDAKSNVLLLRKKLTPERSQERPVFLASVQDIRTELDEVQHRLSAGPVAP